ncbi:PilZ domain-containing protein [Roseibium sp. MMSF_3412]|uniref:PilZ domain-containing protein n=1 Tax=Roseibium sp. MMSF_3412 TaxID=3046712 RepID=UPI00273ED6D8|nr:PilZ domain-containing protein [Roseibium sp. MMSF_3412]
MSNVTIDPALASLQESPEASEDVQVVDFDTLAIVDAVITNVTEWGCKVTTEHADELYKNIGIRFPGARKLSKAQVTSVKGNDASVVFVTSESKTSDKRRETRNDVKIPVKIADLEGITELEGTIVDAAKNGCKVKANGLTALPEEVLLTMAKFNKPVVAEFAWRNDKSAGLRLLWDRTLEETEGPEVQQEAEAASEETEDA